MGIADSDLWSLSKPDGTVDRCRRRRDITDAESPVENEGSTDAAEDSDEVGTATGSPPREPVRTGLLARPGEVGGDDGAAQSHAAGSESTTGTEPSNTTTSESSSETGDNGSPGSEN